MAILEVTLKIPLEEPILFSHWFPLEPGDEIIIARGRFAIRLWFDSKCLEDGDMIRSEKLLDYHSVGANSVFVGIEVDVDPSLVTAIESRDPLKGAAKCRELCDEMQDGVIQSVNRLIQYSRSINGQYWLSEIGGDKANPSQFFHKYLVKALGPVLI